MRYLLPFIIVCMALGAVWYVKSNAPQAQTRPAPKAPRVVVDTLEIKAKDIQLELQSFGQISAKTTSTLTSQVSGLVTAVSPLFEEGAFFNQGDLLLSLDNRDFQSAINTAKANLTQAQQDLALERAQVNQAKADWKRLNKKKPVPALVSRTPQTLKAKAKVSAAHAQYNQAIINFKRTKISAPFTGRILSKQVNIGDYINANSALAQIMTTDALQVRLSLKNSDLAFIDLPESNSTVLSQLPKVLFETDLISKQIWQGAIVRTEASIDSNSQQLFVVGEITQPFAVEQSDKYPLKIGQYVNARIKGKQLKNAIIIDINAIYQGQFVYVLSNKIITRRNIKIAWQDDKTALIAAGLSDNDQLITSILSIDAQGSVATSRSQLAKKGKGKSKKETPPVKAPVKAATQ